MLYRAKIDGQNVSRPFTPITPHNVSGRIDLLIKVPYCALKYQF